MSTPVALTDEQFAMLRRVEAETARLAENPDLRDDQTAMQMAGNLLKQAQDMNLPEVSLVSLRNWVNLHDRSGD